ncbi:hypothetical protein RchiOBHm_Chr2g0115851 [Rosa chinensis]|uniref:Uncharacterized protein n=1 Tax=Rosa chinensis TaxID=74649 RepID=A0A2P6RR74_ROSCH|nr:hypothetical protein RchiOBHm_Chr2g0115851 [Rosa chinensis]
MVGIYTHTLSLSLVGATLPPRFGAASTPRHLSLSLSVSLLSSLLSVSSAPSRSLSSLSPPYRANLHSFSPIRANLISAGRERCLVSRPLKPHSKPLQLLLSPKSVIPIPTTKTRTSPRAPRAYCRVQFSLSSIEMPSLSHLVVKADAFMLPDDDAFCLILPFSLTSDVDRCVEKRSIAIG